MHNTHTYSYGNILLCSEKKSNTFYAKTYIVITLTAPHVSSFFLNCTYFVETFFLFIKERFYSITTCRF